MEKSIWILAEIAPAAAAAMKKKVGCCHGWHEPMVLLLLPLLTTMTMVELLLALALLLQLRQQCEVVQL